MAGDWIKVEHATLEKPEVMLMAELLGIKRDEVIGILCRFWVWLDRNTGNGFVTHVSRIGIDEVMHCAGFATALEAVGWCSFDDKGRTMSMPNADRHNFSPAKTRALGRDRTAKSRNAFVTPTALPEKRREENIKPIEPPPKKIGLAEPTPEHQALADSLGVACKTEWAKYRDWMASSGKRHKDEAAGFRNWLRRAGADKPRLLDPVRHGSHVPAKIPEMGERTDMPDSIRSQLAQFTAKIRVA